MFFNHSLQTDLTAWTYKISRKIVVFYYYFDIYHLPIVFCSTCDKDALYVLQAIAFDTFTVGSALIMILVNSTLRGSVFKGIKRTSIVSVS
ncbi:hypothetical protein L3Y34_019058 [Caenorhabditis briggsae]|uniref:Serpentine receptor class gamma n=1 Tax=Caenorhabditis briggsae TaxID=6238 RepID=A0AAE9IVH5_CAEBR|nr:hypothetical protein L3Y34_019058 [Caenorhabditis briggsae]